MRTAGVLGLAVAMLLPTCSRKRNEAPARPPRKQQASEVRAVFVDPEDSGRRIDECLSRGQRCGRPAAEYFCRLNGFVHADEFATIAGAFPTIGLADMAPACDPINDACVAFELIVCTEPALPPLD